MKLKKAVFSIALIGIGFFSNAQSVKDEQSSSFQAIGIDALLRLDLVPQLKTQIHTGMFSSYDRTGGNDDGFSGKYSFIRKEGDDLVIAEMQGPGAIYRMHMPGPQDGIIEFYFDGEKTPRISMKINEMIDGKHSPFLAPLVGSGVGGRYIYVPLTYQASCKIIVKAPIFCFYDINYATYPKNTIIPTFQNPPTEEWMRKVRKAGSIMESTGTNISKYLVREGARIETVKINETVSPGKTVELYRTDKPGRIVGLRIGPAKSFAGKAKDMVINMYWDHDKKPAVSCPVGDLFGYSFGEPATRSLFSGTSDNLNYLYLPMPFATAARIELVSESANKEPVQVTAEIDVNGEGKRQNEGHFYALWNRENPCTPGKPFTYLNTEGNGHVVGVFLQAQGKKPGGTPFFEGDDIVVLDGEMTIHGTGSEDSFNGGWYDVPARWEERASFPFSGCLDYKKYLGRTGGYRWMIPDAFVFRKSIDYTIEHGPEGNLENTDYTSVVFFYSSVRPSANLALPELKDRKITDPDQIVFVPGWNVPIHSSPLSNGIIEKRGEQFGNGWVRYFSLKTTGPDEFGAHHVSFIFDIPAAGKYTVSVKSLNGPDQGIIQMFRHDMPQGEPVDLYSIEPRISANMPLGTLDLTEGDNVLYFKLIGQNPDSKGLNMKIIEFVFDRIH
jgi:hypothetical protein